MVKIPLQSRSDLCKTAPNSSDLYPHGEEKLLDAESSSVALPSESLNKAMKRSFAFFRTRRLPRVKSPARELLFPSFSCFGFQNKTKIRSQPTPSLFAHPEAPTTAEL
ncbi:hypothetical protein KFK09_028609 [Dendrobium nobile]|uniref:Uncharacterized protein n=1 Tax=Dendrobium nobile TaxID=94219 RepID=A0A8T3A3Z8_DENNO|nr:hypothetical protein KFK09_028609 [Dendrobium nobile]